MHDIDKPASHEPGLRRVLTLWPLVFYGLSVIVGAGIYVAIGAVIRRAGAAAPLSFLFAGIAAGLTGLCYAELAGRFPEASGGVAYVRHGFRSDRLAQLTGAAMTMAVAIAAASIARGAVHYLAVLLPFSTPILTVALVAGFTGIATLGVRESVGLAAAMGVVEIAGLLVAIAAGALAAPEFHMAGMIPMDMAGWRGAFAGAFIAFFAFIGFETLANLAEEVKDPKQTCPSRHRRCGRGEYCSLCRGRDCCGARRQHRQQPSARSVRGHECLGFRGSRRHCGRQRCIGGDRDARSAILRHGPQ